MREFVGFLTIVYDSAIYLHTSVLDNLPLYLHSQSLTMTNAILSPHQSAFGVSAVLLVIIYWNFEFIQDTDIYEALSDILSDMLYGGLNNLSATMAVHISFPVVRVGLRG